MLLIASVCKSNFQTAIYTVFFFSQLISWKLMVMIPKLLSKVSGVE